MPTKAGSPLVRTVPWLPTCTHPVMADEGTADCTGSNVGVHEEGKFYLGTLDTVFLFAYAFGLFFRCSPFLVSHITQLTEQYTVAIWRSAQISASSLSVA